MLKRKISNINHYIILGMAGLKIRIYFEKVNPVSIMEKMEKFVKKNFRNFIANNINIDNYNYEIKFVDKGSMKIFNKDNTGEFYVNLYQNNDFEKQIITYYQISSFHFQFLLKMVILRILGKNRGFILHASASRIGKRALVFLGKSGSGKSTIVKLLRPKYQSLAEDSAIIRKEGENFYFYQTPLEEKDIKIIKKPQKYEIAGFYFLKKSKTFKILKLTNKISILNKFIKQLYTEEKFSRMQTKLLIKLVSEQKHIYNLYFAKRSNKLINFLSTLD